MKLIDALTILRGAPKNAKPFRLFLVCGFTPLHLQTLLAARLQSLLPDRRVEIHGGLYGDIAGNLQRAAEFEGDAAAAVLEWPDLDPRLGIRSLGGWGPKELQDIIENVHRQVARIQKFLPVAARRVPLAVSFPALPLPPIDHTPSWHGGQLELALQEQAASLALSAAQQINVKVVAPAFLLRHFAGADRGDVQSELVSGFPYRIPFASVLAEGLASLILNRTPKKGLITDLDDTLWSGIVGEVGMEGISWDLDHHSQLHGLYQQVLQALSEQGVLVGVATKNDAALVKQVLGSEKLHVRERSIFPVEANWGAKSNSVARILKAWNVSADSVVFVDDNAMDLAEVKAAYPDIECIPFPKGDYRAAYELIERLRDLFGKDSISAEDSIRTESLRKGAIFSEEAMGSASPDAFLRQSEARIKLNLRKLPFERRSLDLVNKTNQFNLNGKRQTEGSWQALLSRSDTFLLSAYYEDKYGPLGQIAVISGRTEPNRLLIDTWVMSCRAFSRRIEHQCLAYLFRKFGAEEAVLDFEATPRNGPLQEFLRGISALNGSAQVRISEKSFAAACPELSHVVEELNHD